MQPTPKSGPADFCVRAQAKGEMMTMIARDHKAAYRMGFFHCAILPAVKLILGEFGLSESHTELLKGISPLKASIERLLPKKEGAPLLKKLDDIYQHAISLKYGEYKDKRHADGIFNAVEDSCREVEQILRGFSEARFDERAAFLFDVGRLLSIWHDMTEPPYKLSSRTMNGLLDKLKAAKLAAVATKAKAVYDSFDDESPGSHSAPRELHLDIQRQLEHETIQEAYSVEAGEQVLSPLTRLPSLPQFEIDSVELITDSESPDSVAFIDMDNLKQINSDIGHDAADEVIKELSIRLETALRHRAKVYHRSGDEFLVVLHNTSSREAMIVLNRVINGIKSKSISTSHGNVNITISAGIASFPEHANELETLMKRANEAMQQAKEAGKARAVLWSKRENSNNIEL